MKTRRQIFSIVFALLLPALVLADPPPDFEARLELYRNGKLSGETLFRLVSKNGHWSMFSETKGTKGVASWIGLQESSSSEGDWQEGDPRPLRYERNVRAIKSMRWTAEFDWDRGEVRTVYPDGESLLALQPNVLD